MQNIDMQNGVMVRDEGLKSGIKLGLRFNSAAHYFSVYHILHSALLPEVWCKYCMGFAGIFPSSIKKKFFLISLDLMKLSYEFSGFLFLEDGTSTY